RGERCMWRGSTREGARRRGHSVAVARHFVYSQGHRNRPDSHQEKAMTRTTTPRRDDAGSRQSAPENRSRAATAAYPTKNDLPEAARGEAVALLNQRLADCIDLQTQCKQAHWNVKGPTFIALHKLFDEINEDVEGYVDLIAERIVQLGGIAEGTVGVVADRST